MKPLIPTMGFGGILRDKGDEAENCGFGGTMTGGSLGLRTASYGSMQQPQNDVFQIPNSFNVRKPSKMPLSGLREKERFLPFICRYLGRRNVGMLILVALALLAFLIGFITVNKEDASESTSSYIAQTIQNMKLSMVNTVTVCGENNSPHPPTSHSSVSRVVADSAPLLGNPCKHFAIPPPPPGERKRIGPRPCPVCYLPVEQAIARMPRSPSVSAVIHHLNYFREENPIKTEPHGGSEFGGFPSLKQRNESFNIQESMTVHCGFVKGCRPGYQTAFDIDEADLRGLEQFHDVIVASAIFGNYDIMQQPTNISEVARENVPFVMFIDEETEKYMKNSSGLDSSKRVGLWRIVVVCNIPYTDPRRNGKNLTFNIDVLRSRHYSCFCIMFMNSILDVGFLWRQNATFAISRHYRRFDVFEEAEANKAAGKYDNASINYQIEIYKKQGLTPYSDAKLPITSDFPEGCVIIREHIPTTNLFTCLWFNEVDRFTSRDQLSFSTVRDRIMAQVNWSVDMFMDCERRNFVI
ncbi:hypothetical protein CsSME_00026445 [Camellia sinensis var. sinensis]